MTTTIETIERMAGLTDAEGNRQEWYIQVYHGPTGIPMSADSCPRYYTREQAREELRDRRRHAAAALASEVR